MSDYESISDYDAAQAAQAANSGEAKTTPPREMTADEMLREAEQAAQYAASLRRMAGVRAVAEAAARRPVMPEIAGDGPGPVVTFSKYQSGREYHYAAIGWRVGNAVRWAVTGTNTDRMNWAGLLKFIGESNWHTLARVETTVNIGPTPEQEPAVAERMGNFGRVTAFVDLDANAGAYDPHAKSLTFMQFYGTEQY